MLARRRLVVAERARRLLSEAGITRPPVPVESIADHLGIPIVRDPLPGQDVSGFYLRQGERQVIGVNSAHAPVRQRFTIAHEIGHAVLAEQDHLYVDRVTRLRGPRSAEGTDPAEIEANAFAAELLMPEEMLSRHLDAHGGIDPYDQAAVHQLADAFQVSTQAMLIRLGVLNLAPPQDSPF